MLTSHLCMRQVSRRQRTSRPLVQEKYPRYQRHAMLNDIIWRAIKRAQIPVHKGPTALITHGGKRPDGATLIPWSKGKPLAWNATVPNTFADSHKYDVTGSRSYSQISGVDVEHQIHWHHHYSFLLPHIYRNRRLMRRACFGGDHRVFRHRGYIIL